MSSLFRALFNGSSKHKKLSEEWATIREPVVDGVTFYCKYLGSTLVDDPKGEAATAEAIKRIIHAAKQVARKPERVSLHVSLQGIRMEDTATSDILLQTSIYKISYCSADAHYDHVFAFIANNDNDTCECHAFLCPKRKMAQAVTISIAQAFNLAYEYWKMSLENKENGEIYAQEELPAEVRVRSGVVQNGYPVGHSQPSSRTSSPIPIRSDSGSSDISTSGYQSSTQALLIDLEDSSEHNTSTTTTVTTAATSTTSAQLCPTKSSFSCKPLNAFDDLSEVSDGFSRLALRRESHPPHLPGTSPLGWAELDLAAFMAPPPASPTGSGFWPSASSPLTSSPSPTSPTPSSPTDPWFRSQSPSGEVSHSPITAFLHSCQSPPSHDSFPSFVQSANKFNRDHFFPANNNEHLVQENNEADVSPSPEHSTNPFTSSQDLNPFHSELSPNHPESVTPSLPVSSCGSVQPAWNGNLFSDSKAKNVMCS